MSQGEVISGGGESMTQDKHGMLRRSDIRSHVTPIEIKGLVCDESNKRREPTIIWNISDQGFCFWVTDRFKPGDIVQLTVAKPWVLQMTCEVRWCKSYEEKSGEKRPGYLIGVQVLDNLNRLGALHRLLNEQTRGTTDDDYGDVGS